MRRNLPSSNNPSGLFPQPLSLSKVKSSSQLRPQSALFHTRKVEGFDVRSPTGLSSSTYKQNSPFRSNFRDTVESIKSRNKEKTVQEEYINGLQDEIKYLEYELKLLKDKELEQHSAVEQLEKFFDDGIPINENILAMKNCFNNQKQQLEQTTDKLAQECKQKETFINGVKSEIDKLKKMLAKAEKDQATREDLYLEKLVELTQKYTETIRATKQIQDENKMLQVRNKKLNEDLGLIRRNNQMADLLASSIPMDTKTILQSTLKTNLQQKDKQILQLELEKIEFQQKLADDSYNKELEEYNTEIKKKILLVTKEVNLYNNKIQEVKFALEQKLKQRDNEAALKREAAAKLEMLKKQLDQENMMNEETMEIKIRERESNLIKELEKSRCSLNKYIIFNKGEADKLEAETQEILQEKPTLLHKISELTNEIEFLANKVKSEQERDIQLVSEIEKLKTKQDVLQGYLENIPQENSKMQHRINTLTEGIESMKKEIKIKEKQIQLIKELKSFNLEELQMIKSTSSNLKGNILGFLKKWEAIHKENYIV